MTAIDDTSSGLESPNASGRESSRYAGSPNAATMHSDGGRLLSTLERIFQRYLHLPEGVSLVLSLWTIHTHAISAAEHFPILYIRSPEKGCGKTTLLRVLKALCRDALLAVDISPSALFRLLAVRRRTVLLDEGDMVPQKVELIRLLNSGHMRGTSVVRTEKVGESFEPVEFSTWGPKAFAAIGSVLPPQTLDRSIQVILQRRPSNAETIDFTADDEEVLSVVQAEVAAWVDLHEQQLRQIRPLQPEGFTNRRADNWRPLLAIAEALGPDVAERARAIGSSLAEEQPEVPSERQMMLEDLAAYFFENSTTDCPTTHLQHWLEQLEHRPWADYFGHGRPISANKIAELLGAYGISPRKHWLPNRSKQYRGYVLDAKLKQVIRAYVPETTELPMEQPEHADTVTPVPPVPAEKRTGVRLDLRTGRVKP
ncbi:MAG TPA: DUF3631 domain-containing protein [Gemmatimonadaceae bacterium]|nr:DUF3631 domain-containing protein [Gemmatimonadaceae bacterium]